MIGAAINAPKVATGEIEEVPKARSPRAPRRAGGEPSGGEPLLGATARSLQSDAAITPTTVLAIRTNGNPRLSATPRRSVAAWRTRAATSLADSVSPA